MSPTDYTNWANGQPNLKNGDCVYENVQQGSGKWFSDAIRKIIAIMISSLHSIRKITLEECSMRPSDQQI
uniref:C-type lectin domain-containing protein n=1 Tax=Ascaris lumbricoides TaxID=6252 RepID=A0A0M3I9U3_ASCLU